MLLLLFGQPIVVKMIEATLFKSGERPGRTQWNLFRNMPILGYPIFCTCGVAILLAAQSIKSGIYVAIDFKSGNFVNMYMELMAVLTQHIAALPQFRQEMVTLTRKILVRAE